MNHPIVSLIEQRASASRYDASRPVSDERLRQLADLATRAPSAYHLQNWQLIAVRSEAEKQRLFPIAFEQQQILDAAATFIVCGTLESHNTLADRLKPCIAAGIMDADVAAGWVGMATSAHQGSPQTQRDEAIRSASLAAMTLMLAAEGMGLNACAIGGFDAERLTSAFDLHTRALPVMLITVGYGLENNWPQKPRLPLSDVFAIR